MGKNRYKIESYKKTIDLLFGIIAYNIEDLEKNMFENNFAFKNENENNEFYINDWSDRYEPKYKIIKYPYLSYHYRWYESEERVTFDSIKIERYCVSYLYEYFLYLIINIVCLGDEKLVQDKISNVPQIFTPSIKWIFDDMIRAQEIRDRWDEDSAIIHSVIDFLDTVSDYNMQKFFSDMLLNLFLSINGNHTDDAKEKYENFLNQQLKYIENIDENYKGYFISADVRLEMIAKTAEIVEQKKDKIEQEEKNKIAKEREKNLKILLEKLDDLVGLQKVKEQVKTEINMIKYNNAIIAQGKVPPERSKHMVFFGNPGTGKTTIARLIAEIYYNLGVINKKEIVEVSRKDVVGKYVGWTADETQKIIDSAIGGILFIDEAYMLAPSYNEGDRQDYGYEAIDTLVKAMEDNRDCLIVIAAGYVDEMKKFIKANPGLESRFNIYINFDDYTSEEMYKIFEIYCKNDSMTISAEAQNYCKQCFEEMYKNKDKTFGNARTVRNFYEKVRENLANRVMTSCDTNINIFEIVLDDVQHIENLKMS